jgi:hypothetical protein
MNNSCTNLVTSNTKELKMDLKTRIDALIEHADQLVAKYWQEQSYNFAPPPKHHVEFISPKWARVVQVDSQKKVYCFVCLQDGSTKALGTVNAGDIHKAASWKAPAKHARGNVFQEDFGNCLTLYGVVCLK